MNNEQESHQELGSRLELFFIDQTSPGSIFWKPRGAQLYNNFIRLMRLLYDRYGYTEVVTPNMYEKKLWMTSGHWEKYIENMFLLEDFHSSSAESADLAESGQKFALKPTNCPGHCLVFQNMRPFSRDLPIRMAEFGVLHRNEASGALHGLTRVRRFQQDDAHIFCRMDQIHKEVLDTLLMIKQVYSLFNMTFNVKLATRPDNFIGTKEIWDMAESELEAVIVEFMQLNDISQVEKNIGDGAFYGPKIDITLIDKFNRPIQCGTVQLDFNLPSEERFNLKYVDEHDQSKHQPVIVHRAVLGSIERFIGIILEHTQGRLPFVVSPYSVKIVTVHKEFNTAAQKLKDHLEKSMRDRNLRLNVDIDLSSDDIREKVKSAERFGYCYIITIGKRENAAIDQDINVASVAIRVNQTVQNAIVTNLIAEFEKLLRFD